VIADYERTIISFGDPTRPTVLASSNTDEQKVEDKELVLNKINRSNYRTIGAILSNRSRDKDRYKFRPMNRAGK